MDLGLKDKVIIVTGGSKGIGKGIVSLLAKEGASIFTNFSKAATILQFPIIPKTVTFLNPNWE